MRKFNPFLVVICVVALVLSACGNSGRTLPSATGSIYEMLIVAPTTALTQAQRDQIACYNLNNRGSAYDEQITDLQILADAIMSEPMPCMPQAEGYFKTAKVSPANFDDFLKPTRNILVFDINGNRYTQTKAVYLSNAYSKPQALARIQSPSADSLIGWWLEHGTEVRQWFVNEEIRRAKVFLRGATNEDARRSLQAWGVDMLIPSDYVLIKDTTDFIWCCNNKGPMRRDILVWRYDYTDDYQLTLGALTEKRDEVVSQIGATVAGSHMGTEYKVFPPEITAIPYGVEMRGLWKMYDGEAMGGPFVSHSVVDSTGLHIITAETYVFAPGQKKRSAVRQGEAILWTMER